MMHTLRLIVFLVFLLAGGVGMAQTTDQQLAVQYYQTGEFDKAAIYFEKLYKKSPDEFYEQYMASLTALKDFSGAEKLAKKQSKRHPEDLTLLIDLGTIYHLNKSESKGRQQFEKVIKSLPANAYEIKEVANAFTEIGEKDFALATYQKGRKLMKDYPFNLEIAQVYGDMGRFEDMIREYLDLLEVRPNYVQTVQNVLSRTIGFEEETPANAMLKETLLKKIQRNPDVPLYSEMIIWMYIQQKKFNSAFVQAKALDRREKEDGGRLIALANLCISNEAYDTAIKCLKYVTSKGSENYYYIDSKIRLLNVSQEKIIRTGQYTQEELETIEKEYLSTLDELGRTEQTALLMRDLGHLYAFYLHDSDKAVTVLEEAINLPRIKPHDQARCKLELGDVLLTLNEIWDASLYYAQVDKDFKYDVLGEEAKFKNAKIFYYTGDFGWAKAQLDVLKGATTKLIANDALDLSLLITDNTGIDTTENTLKMFARADLMEFQNKDDLAVSIMDSINTMYPGHAVDDEILYKRYEIAYKRKNYEEAAQHLDKIIGSYGDDLLGDNALFKLAELSQYQLNDADRAKELYQQLLVDYPASLFVVEARKRFRLLRGDDIN